MNFNRTLDMAAKLNHLINLGHCGTWHPLTDPVPPERLADMALYINDHGTLEHPDWWRDFHVSHDTTKETVERFGDEQANGLIRLKSKDNRLLYAAHVSEFDSGKMVLRRFELTGFPPLGTIAHLVRYSPVRGAASVEFAPRYCPDIKAIAPALEQLHEVAAFDECSKDCIAALQLMFHNYKKHFPTS